MSTNFTGLRQVGEFPAPGMPVNRRTKNPIDKSTIVSIYPKDIHERKYTIEPGVFDIPAGSVEKPGILVVGSSSWWRNIDDAQPPLEIPVSSVEVSNSVINDCINGMIEVNMATARPGLFFVLGEMSVGQVKIQCADKIKEAEQLQRNWYQLLVRIADSLWARANGNPLTISDEMRIAAKELGMKDKPWLMDYNIVEMKSCVACGNLKNPAFPVCATCKHIDMTHPAAKDMQFAK